MPRRLRPGRPRPVAHRPRVARAPLAGVEQGGGGRLSAGWGGVLVWGCLGNPEPGMSRNRHNIGFMAVDAVASRHGFAPWRQRFKGLVSEGTIAGERILALKPQTYMNESGASVQQAAAFYKLPPDTITAFHDEL